MVAQVFLPFVNLLCFLLQGYYNGKRKESGLFSGDENRFHFMKII